MLPARRHRNYVCFAELMLVALLGTTGANAQATGATRVSQVAPTAVAPTAAAPAAAAPAAAAPTAAAPAAAAPAAAEPAAAPLPQQSQPLLPTHAVGPRADLNSTVTDAEGSDAPLRDRPLRKPPESARWLLIGAGLGTTALWYAGAYGIRELWPSQADRSDLRVPLAGPFMDLAHTGCPASNTDCSTFQLVVRTVMVTIDAIGQAGGVALMLQGAVLSTASVEAPRSNRSASLRRSTPSTAVLPVPWTDGNSGGGIGLVGRF